MLIIALYLPTNEVKKIPNSEWAIKEQQMDIHNNLVYQFLSTEEEPPPIVANAPQARGTAPQLARKKSGCNCKK